MPKKTHSISFSNLGLRFCYCALKKSSLTCEAIRIFSRGWAHGQLLPQAKHFPVILTFLHCY